MGAFVTKAGPSTSRKDAPAPQNSGRFSQDEVAALVMEVRRCADVGKELPPLVQAASTGREAAVERYLQEGGSLWARDSAGRTPLHWAAGACGESLVGALLALGAEVGARDRRRATPLHHAAVGRNAAATARLLAAGASTVARDCDGRTPLMCAAGAGDVPVCQLLAADGPGPGLEAAERFKQTALHLAARAGKAAAVKVLVARGASVRATDDQQRTPLHSAFIFHQERQEDALVARSFPRRSDDKSPGNNDGKDGDPAEITRQVVEELLAGKDLMKAVCHRDNSGMIPLTWALRLRLPAVARALVGFYRPDYDTDSFGKTVLHWAASAGDAHVVRCILKFMFSPWKPDMTRLLLSSTPMDVEVATSKPNQGCDSLMLAIESRNLETVKAILDNRKYVARRNWMGQSALHIAVSYLDVEMTRYLLERGATVGSEDRDGRTALFRVLEKGEAGRGVARLLLSAGAFRLQRGRSDRRRRTLLHAAAEGGDAELVRQLLRLGASPRARDEDGESPLAVALRLRHRPAAAVLLEPQHLRLTTDRRGRTPLHWAVAAGWHREAHVLQVAGCDPAQRDQYGRSAIVAAAEHDHWQLAAEMCDWTSPGEPSKARK